MAPLMMSRNKPRVTTINGMEKKTKIGLMIALINPRTRATISAEVKLSM